MRSEKDEDRPGAKRRLFIAISIPRAVKDEIEKAQAELKHALPAGEVRWTKPAQFHLTLKFLGEVDSGGMEELTAALRAADRLFPALALRAHGIGAFPNVKSPRVIWAGVSDAKGILGNLQLAVEQAVTRFTNEKPEGEFNGHVTLGRMPGVKRAAEIETFNRRVAAMANREFGEWQAETVEIICSELSAAGAKYTTLAEIPLSGAL